MATENPTETNHYYSSYALVQVSPQRWMVIRMSGCGRSGDDPYWTVSTRSQTPPVKFREASIALRQFQEDEAKERVEREAKREAYEREGRSPYFTNPGSNHNCPVCLDRKAR